MLFWYEPEEDYDSEVSNGYYYRSDVNLAFVEREKKKVEKKKKEEDFFLRNGEKFYGSYAFFKEVLRKRKGVTKTKKKWKKIWKQYRLSYLNVVEKDLEEKYMKGFEVERPKGFGDREEIGTKDLEQNLKDHVPFTSTKGKLFTSFFGDGLDYDVWEEIKVALFSFPVVFYEKEALFFLDEGGVLHPKILDADIYSPGRSGGSNFSEFFMSEDIELLEEEGQNEGLGLFFDEEYFNLMDNFFKLEYNLREESTIYRFEEFFDFNFLRYEKAPLKDPAPWVLSGEDDGGGKGIWLYVCVALIVPLFEAFYSMPFQVDSFWLWEHRFMDFTDLLDKDSNEEWREYEDHGMFFHGVSEDEYSNTGWDLFKNRIYFMGPPGAFERMDLVTDSSHSFNLMNWVDNFWSDFNYFNWMEKYGGIPLKAKYADPAIEEHFDLIHGVFGKHKWDRNYDVFCDLGYTEYMEGLGFYDTKREFGGLGEKSPNFFNRKAFYLSEDMDADDQIRKGVMYTGEPLEMNWFEYDYQDNRDYYSNLQTTWNPHPMYVYKEGSMRSTTFKPIPEGIYLKDQVLFENIDLYFMDKKKIQLQLARMFHVFNFKKEIPVNRFPLFVKNRIVKPMGFYNLGDRTHSQMQALFEKETEFLYTTSDDKTQKDTPFLFEDFADSTATFTGGFHRMRLRPFSGVLNYKDEYSRKSDFSYGSYLNFFAPLHREQFRGVLFGGATRMSLFNPLQRNAFFQYLDFFDQKILKDHNFLDAGAKHLVGGDFQAVSKYKFYNYLGIFGHGFEYEGETPDSFTGYGVKESNTIEDLLIVDEDLTYEEDAELKRNMIEYKKKRVRNKPWFQRLRTPMDNYVTDEGELYKVVDFRNDFITELIDSGRDEPYILNNGWLEYPAKPFDYFSTYNIGVKGQRGYGYFKNEMDIFEERYEDFYFKKTKDIYLNLRATGAVNYQPVMVDYGNYADFYDNLYFKERLKYNGLMKDLVTDKRNTTITRRSLFYNSMFAGQKYQSDTAIEEMQKFLGHKRGGFYKDKGRSFLQSYGGSLTEFPGERGEHFYDHNWEYPREDFDFDYDRFVKVRFRRIGDVKVFYKEKDKILSYKWALKQPDSRSVLGVNHLLDNLEMLDKLGITSLWKDKERKEALRLATRLYVDQGLDKMGSVYLSAEDRLRINLEYYNKLKGSVYDPTVWDGANLALGSDITSEVLDNQFVLIDSVLKRNLFYDRHTLGAKFSNEKRVLREQISMEPLYGENLSNYIYSTDLGVTRQSLYYNKYQKMFPQVYYNSNVNPVYLFDPQEYYSTRMRSNFDEWQDMFKARFRSPIFEQKFFEETDIYNSNIRKWASRQREAFGAFTGLQYRGHVGPTAKTIPYTASRAYVLNTDAVPDYWLLGSRRKSGLSKLMERSMNLDSRLDLIYQKKHVLGSYSIFDYPYTTRGFNLLQSRLRKDSLVFGHYGTSESFIDFWETKDYLLSWHPGPSHYAATIGGGSVLPDIFLTYGDQRYISSLERYHSRIKYFPLLYNYYYSWYYLKAIPELQQAYKRNSLRDLRQLTPFEIMKLDWLFFKPKRNFTKEFTQTPLWSLRRVISPEDSLGSSTGLDNRAFGLSFRGALSGTENANSMQGAYFFGRHQFKGTLWRMHSKGMALEGFSKGLDGQSVFSIGDSAFGSRSEAIEPFLKEDYEYLDEEFLYEEDFEKEAQSYYGFWEHDNLSFANFLGLNEKEDTARVRDGVEMDDVLKKYFIGPRVVEPQNSMRFISHNLHKPYRLIKSSFNGFGLFNSEGTWVYSALGYQEKPKDYATKNYSFFLHRRIGGSLYFSDRLWDKKIVPNFRYKLMFSLDKRGGWFAEYKPYNQTNPFWTLDFEGYFPKNKENTNIFFEDRLDQQFIQDNRLKYFNELQEGFLNKRVLGYEDVREKNIIYQTKFFLPWNLNKLSTPFSFTNYTWISKPFFVNDFFPGLAFQKGIVYFPINHFFRDYKDLQGLTASWFFNFRGKTPALNVLGYFTENVHTVVRLFGSSCFEIVGYKTKGGLHEFLEYSSNFRAFSNEFSEAQRSFFRKRLFPYVLQEYGKESLIEFVENYKKWNLFSTYSTGALVETYRFPGEPLIWLNYKISTIDYSSFNFSEKEKELVKKQLSQSFDFFEDTFFISFMKKNFIDQPLVETGGLEMKKGFFGFNDKFPRFLMPEVTKHRHEIYTDKLLPSKDFSDICFAKLNLFLKSPIFALNLDNLIGNYKQEKNYQPAGLTVFRKQYEEIAPMHSKSPVSDFLTNKPMVDMFSKSYQLQVRRQDGDDIFWFFSAQAKRSPRNITFNKFYRQNGNHLLKMGQLGLTPANFWGNLQNRKFLAGERLYYPAFRPVNLALSVFNGGWTHMRADLENNNNLLKFGRMPIFNAIGVLEMEMAQPQTNKADILKYIEYNYNSYNKRQFNGESLNVSDILGLEKRVMNKNKVENFLVLEPRLLTNVFDWDTFTSETETYDRFTVTRRRPASEYTKGTILESFKFIKPEHYPSIGRGFADYNMPVKSKPSSSFMDWPEQQTLLTTRMQHERKYWAHQKTAPVWRASLDFRRADFDSVEVFTSRAKAVVSNEEYYRGGKKHKFIFGDRRFFMDKGFRSKFWGSVPKFKGDYIDGFFSEDRFKMFRSFSPYFLHRPSASFFRWRFFDYLPEELGVSEGFFSRRVLTEDLLYYLNRNLSEPSWMIFFREVYGVSLNSEKSGSVFLGDYRKMPIKDTFYTTLSSRYVIPEQKFPHNVPKFNTFLFHDWTYANHYDITRGRGSLSRILKKKKSEISFVRFLDKFFFKEFSYLGTERLRRGNFPWVFFGNDELNFPGQTGMFHEVFLNQDPFYIKTIPNMQKKKGKFFFAGLFLDFLKNDPQFYTAWHRASIADKAEVVDDFFYKPWFYLVPRGAVLDTGHSWMGHGVDNGLLVTSILRRHLGYEKFSMTQLDFLPLPNFFSHVNYADLQHKVGMSFDNMQTVMPMRYMSNNTFFGFSKFGSFFYFFNNAFFSPEPFVRYFSRFPSWGGCSFEGFFFKKIGGTVDFYEMMPKTIYYREHLGGNRHRIKIIEDEGYDILPLSFLRFRHFFNFQINYGFSSLDLLSSVVNKANMRKPLGDLGVMKSLNGFLSVTGKGGTFKPLFDVFYKGPYNFMYNNRKSVSFFNFLKENMLENQSIGYLEDNTRSSMYKWKRFFKEKGEEDYFMFLHRRDYLNTMQGKMNETFLVDLVSVNPKYYPYGYLYHEYPVKALFFTDKTLGWNRNNTISRYVFYGTLVDGDDIQESTVVREQKLYPYNYNTYPYTYGKYTFNKSKGFYGWGNLISVQGAGNMGENGDFEIAKQYADIFPRFKSSYFFFSDANINSIIEKEVLLKYGKKGTFGFVYENGYLREATKVDLHRFARRGVWIGYQGVPEFQMYLEGFFEWYDRDNLLGRLVFFLNEIFIYRGRPRLLWMKGVGYFLGPHPMRA